MTVCQRCNKREAITVIGGRKLCEYCARDEIIKRIRKEMYESKAFHHQDNVVIIVNQEFKPLSSILKTILSKACYKCHLSIDEFEIESKDNINESLWSMIIKAYTLPHKIKVLPFTSDFLLAYMIYTVSVTDASYLSFSKPFVIHNNTLFFIPLYNTSIDELKGFAELNLTWKDKLFNKIYEWVNSSLRDNYELFHTFHTSIKLFQKPVCKYCNAFIDEGDYCQRCKNFLVSPSHLY